MVLTIAMDGPVGAGKSSVADEVARRLGILHPVSYTHLTLPTILRV